MVILHLVIISGINSNFYNTAGNRSTYSVIPPNDIIVIAGKTIAISRDATAKLGTRFGFSFSLNHYLDVGFDTGKYEQVDVGFSGIALSQ